MDTSGQRMGVASRGLIAAAALALSACSDADSGTERQVGDAVEQEGNSGDGGADFGNAVNNPDFAGADAQVPQRPVELPADCVGETQSAQQVDVDMYIMLDRSGSMLDVTGAGDTKWDAVRSALGDFVADPQSDGLGVGLQYFPLGAPGIPESCSSDAECGAAAPCTNKVCLPSRNPLAPPAAVELCLSAADCPSTSAGCAEFGVCSGLQNAVCFDFGPTGCGVDGSCDPIAGECLLFASCEVADYFQPAVPIDLLPGNGMAFTDSLLAAQPTGLTPTPVALAGAIERASAHAMDNPTHRVLAVLATDGLPTDCLPADTPDIAAAVGVVSAIAAQGTALDPAIETYVIGVFAPEDPNAMQQLDQIAEAGGTERAFIVDPAQDVSAQFLDALAEIRGGTLACELQLPSPPDSQQLDFGRVNVELTDDSGTRALRYVQSEANCDQAELAWYYDVQPEQGGTPTRISVCPATCDALRSASRASVEIRLGCATLGPD